MSDRMCEVAWCTCLVAPDSTFCVVHRDHPEYVPRSEAIKHNWLKREERERVVAKTSRQEGARGE